MCPLVERSRAPVVLDLRSRERAIGRSRGQKLSLCERHALDTFRCPVPKAARMKIDETTIGVNGVPQLPLVGAVQQQPSASSLRCFRHVYFGIDRIRLEAPGIYARRGLHVGRKRNCKR